MPGNNLAAVSRPIDTRTFAEKILGVPPSEEIIYHSAMQQKLWTIDEFAALMGGLTPENYKAGIKEPRILPMNFLPKGKLMPLKYSAAS